MKTYKRDKQGYLCLTNSNGEITGKVPEDNSETNKFMFSVDTEFNDEYESKRNINRPWTE